MANNFPRGGGGFIIFWGCFPLSCHVMKCPYGELYRVALAQEVEKGQPLIEKVCGLISGSSSLHVELYSAKLLNSKLLSDEWNCLFPHLSLVMIFWIRAGSPTDSLDFYSVDHCWHLKHLKGRLILKYNLFCWNIFCWMNLPFSHLRGSDRGDGPFWQ